MKSIEIERLRVNGIDYIIGLNVYTVESEKIACPWIMITTKSSKKKRGKSATKEDGHFLLLNDYNPFPFVYKAAQVFERILKDYDHLLLEAYGDKTQKRLELYERFLVRMGFRCLKKTKRDGWLFSRRVLKKKIIKKFLS